MSALTKVYIIFFLTVFAFFISLPKITPVRFDLGFLNIDTTVNRPSINFAVGNFRFERSLDLILGLDLAGGSHLVFEADTSEISQDRRNAALQGLRDVMERRVNLFGISEPNVQISSFEGKDRIIVELPGVRDLRVAVDMIGRTAQLVFAELGTEEEPGIFPTDLTGADLRRSDVTFDTTTGKPVVSIEFTPGGTEKFARLTRENIGKPLAILLDEEVISAPVVQEEIVGGSAVISGDFTLDDARNLSIQINAGALPVPVDLVEQRTIGATLGIDSIEKSIRAGWVGVAMIAFFMILIYGKLGIISVISLFIFGLLSLSIYKILPIVLTLPGIAGFLLSLGMAVDANVLIFERFKEEVGKRNWQDALEVAFGRAWSSIRDANIATLVTAFVLANPLDFSFLHTSGPIRGFAITLSLGVAVGLFTGIFVTRNLLRSLVELKR